MILIKKRIQKWLPQKKNEENILSNVENNKKKEPPSETFFNDVTNNKFIKESEIIIKNSNESNNIEEEEKIDELCNNLGSNTNIKGLINLPFYITPKYSNNASKRKGSSNSISLMLIRDFREVL